MTSAAATGAVVRRTAWAQACKLFVPRPKRTRSCSPSVSSTCIALRSLDQRVFRRLEEAEKSISQQLARKSKPT